MLLKCFFLTEYGLSHEADTDTEDTMDGSYNTGGSVESTMSGTAKMFYGDDFADEIEDAVVDKAYCMRLGKLKVEYQAKMEMLLNLKRNVEVSTINLN